jgi:hypothetical protein
MEASTLIRWSRSVLLVSDLPAGAGGASGYWFYNR